eukprot:6706698-Pyramimonas_sp.AAC.1
MSLNSYADELSEEMFTGHNEIDLADWPGMPIAGQPADVEFVEDFHMPAEADREMAGAPADSEATTPAREEEIQLTFYPRAFDNPTNMELSDDGPVRGSPRDAGD